MAMTLKLTIVTPERRMLINQSVEALVVPAFKGEVNILPGHAPLITTLDTGVLKWKEAGSSDWTKAALSWGYCQVGPSGLVSVLADLVQLPGEVEFNQETKVIAETEARMGTEQMDDYQWKAAQREIARARAAIDILAATQKI